MTSVISNSMSFTRSISTERDCSEEMNGEMDSIEV